MSCAELQSRATVDAPLDGYSSLISDRRYAEASSEPLVQIILGNLADKFHFREEVWELFRSGSHANQSHTKLSDLKAGAIRA